MHSVIYHLWLCYFFINGEFRQQVHSSNNDILMKLTFRVTKFLHSVSYPTLTPQAATAPIGIKLDGTNYALWSYTVKMFCSGKDKLRFIKSDLPQPSQTDPIFWKWHTDNAILKGRLIDSLDPLLISNFIRFPTIIQAWDSIATTFFDGSDTSQVYEHQHWVTRLERAGDSLEKYYDNLQGLW